MKTPMDYMLEKAIKENNVETIELIRDFRKYEATKESQVEKEWLCDTLV